MRTNPPGSGQRLLTGPRRAESTALSDHARPARIRRNPPSPWAFGNSRRESFHVLAQVLHLLFESAGENGKAAPGLGIEVLVVEVERGCVTLALPLVAAPQSEEPLNP